MAKLEYYGIHTPLEFADKSEGWVKSHFTLPAVQTWRELNGIDCIDTTEIIAKQNICTSRSFGNMISEFQEPKRQLPILHQLVPTNCVDNDLPAKA